MHETQKKIIARMHTKEQFTYSLKLVRVCTFIKIKQATHLFVLYQLSVVVFFTLHTPQQFKVCVNET